MFLLYTQRQSFIAAILGMDVCCTGTNDGLQQIPQMVILASTFVKGLFTLCREPVAQTPLKR